MLSKKMYSEMSQLKKEIVQEVLEVLERDRYYSAVKMTHKSGHNGPDTAYGVMAIDEEDNPIRIVDLIIVKKDGKFVRVYGLRGEEKRGLLFSVQTGEKVDHVVLRNIIVKYLDREPSLTQEEFAYEVKKGIKSFFASARLTADDPKPFVQTEENRIRVGFDKKPWFFEFRKDNGLVKFLLNGPVEVREGELGPSMDEEYQNQKWVPVYGYEYEEHSNRIYARYAICRALSDFVENYIIEDREDRVDRVEELVRDAG